MNSKYAPLESHLRDSGRAHMPMTFDEIEHVIGVRLPAAAFKHRALWSNNPSNWVMTKAWLAAGYQTERVDMEKHKLVLSLSRSHHTSWFRETHSHRPLHSSHASAGGVGDRV